jgi:hypothetical protein
VSAAGAVRRRSRHLRRGRHGGQKSGGLRKSILKSGATRKGCPDSKPEAAVFLIKLSRELARSRESRAITNHHANRRRTCCAVAFSTRGSYSRWPLFDPYDVIDARKHCKSLQAHTKSVSLIVGRLAEPSRSHSPGQRHRRSSTGARPGCISSGAISRIRPMAVRFIGVTCNQARCTCHT